MNGATSVDLEGFQWVLPGGCDGGLGGQVEDEVGLGLCDERADCFGLGDIGHGNVYVVQDGWVDMDGMACEPKESGMGVMDAALLDQVVAHKAGTSGDEDA